MSVPRLDGRGSPDRIGAPGAAVGDRLEWDGMRWVAVTPTNIPETHPGDGINSVAVGSTADGDGAQSVAVGVSTFATTDATAVGYDARAAWADATAVGSQADADGTDGTAIGSDAFCKATSVAVGSGAITTATNAVALGASARAQDVDATSVGKSAWADAAGSISIGAFAQTDTFADRAIALGSNVTNTTADSCLIGADELEVAPSGSSTGTSIILADTVTGTRYRISIASGVLTTALA